MNKLRADMEERVRFVLDEHETERPDCLELIVNECARTALLDTKRRLTGLFMSLKALEATLDSEPTDDLVGVAQHRLKSLMNSVRTWDAQLASQA